MQVESVKWEVQSISYRAKKNLYREGIDDKYCFISFDGYKFYTFKKDNIHPRWWINKFEYIIIWSKTDYIKCDGYYDKDNKGLYFFYNQKINNTYRNIITRQKLERLNQTFFSVTKRDEENMSMKDLLKIKSNRIDLDDAPDSITPTKIESEQRQDPKDKIDCLYVNFYWLEGKDEVVTTMKYRPFHVKALIGRMDELGIGDINEHVGKIWSLEDSKGKLGFPHYLPVGEEG